MPAGRYIVTASHLNLRVEAGIESDVLAVLTRGDLVDWSSDSAVAGWWDVVTVDGKQPGCVARQYLGAESGAAWRPAEITNEILWERTLACEGKVGYLLGAKHSSSGQIDCSGWIEELNLAVFDAVNAAASPDIAFHHADFRLFDTHSDGIISGVEGRTGFALHGPAVTPAVLTPGMLMGLNFGDYAWERGKPPRVYGIDHIVQVMRDPSSGQLFITQSSHSGLGVNKLLLDEWYKDRVRSGMVANGKIHAVDPLLLFDRNTPYAGTAAADVQSTTSVSSPTAASVPAAVAAPPKPPFSGRSYYINGAADLLGQYGSITAVVSELKRCKADAIWVRIHGRGYIGEAKGTPTAPLDNLIAAAKAQGIAVFGWGWCQGDDPEADASLAEQAVARFQVEGYIADIEQGVNGANWSSGDVTTFADAFKASNATLPFALTSHGFIEWHKPEIFDRASDRFDCVNPQTYWSENWASQKMLAAAGVNAGQYTLADPASYARLCASIWSARYKRPVVIAGQIGADDGFTADEALAKLQSFFASYQRPPGVIGEAFWHFGVATRPIRDVLAQS